MILTVTKGHENQLGEWQEKGKVIDVTRPYAKQLIKQGLATAQKPSLITVVAEKTGLKKKKKSKGPWHKSNPMPEKQEIELTAEGLEEPNENEGDLHK